MDLRDDAAFLHALFSAAYATPYYALLTPATMARHMPIRLPHYSDA